MNMKNSLKKNCSLSTLCLLSLFVITGSSKRWSWNQFGQIEPSNFNKNCKERCVAKHLCPYNFIIHSSLCPDQNGEPRVCCTLHIESSVSSTEPLSSDFKPSHSKQSLLTSESVDELPYHPTTTAYPLMTNQEKFYTSSLEKSSIRRRDSTHSQEERHTDNASEHPRQSTNVILMKQNTTAFRNNNSKNSDYELLSNKTGYSLVAENLSSHPNGNSFDRSSEDNSKSKLSAELSEAYEYEINLRRKYSATTGSPYQDFVTFKTFVDEGGEEKVVDLKSTENLSMVRYPSSYWSSNTHSRDKTETPKAWRQPSYASRNNGYSSTEHHKSTKLNDRNSTTFSFQKSTKLPWRDNSYTSSTSKNNEIWNTDRVNTYRKPTKSSWYQSPSTLSSRKVSDAWSTKRTNFERKPTYVNENSYKPLRNNTNIGKTTSSFGWQPTKSWQKEGHFENPHKTTKSWGVKPTSSNQWKTTKSSYNKQTTRAYSRKPTQTGIDHGNYGESSRRYTENWKTNATPRNSFQKPSTTAKNFNKPVTSLSNRATTQPKQTSRRTTISTKPTVQRQKSTPTYKVTTRSNLNNRRTNSGNYNTPSPLPDINSHVCGMRDANANTNGHSTSSRRRNNPDAIIVYPESGEARQRKPTFQRIVGGEEAEPFSWPWVAALYKVTSSGGNRFLCAGSLINENFVLTAAHVFTSEDLRTSSFVVMLGTHNAKEALVEYAVMYVLRHPQYEQRYYYNDIAILRLERPVTFNDFIMPICLPSPSIPLWMDNDLVGKRVTVMGWGNEEFGGVNSRVLKEATFPIVSRESCNASYFQVASNRFPRGITNQMLCAGSPNGGKDACQGDSGGPLTTVEDGRYTQVGIVSFGYKCGDKDYPGVYTKVSHYLNWIAENARCDDNPSHDYRDYYGR